MGPPPRSLAAEANDCFMVRPPRGANRIQGRGAISRALWRAPLGSFAVFHALCRERVSTCPARPASSPAPTRTAATKCFADVARTPGIWERASRNRRKCLDCERPHTSSYADRAGATRKKHLLKVTVSHGRLRAGCGAASAARLRRCNPHCHMPRSTFARSTLVSELLQELPRYPV